MRLKNTIMVTLLALTISVPLASHSGLALAQPLNRSGQPVAPRIEGFSVDEVRRLIPGTELNF